MKQGHRVTVITCAPNFPKGRVFDGYKNNLWSTSTLDGIDVIRVWTFISANSGFLLRTIDYASFLLSALPAALLVRSVDVIVATSPQLFTPCAGLVAAFLKRRPFVFELRDLWPASIQAVGAAKSPRLLKCLEALELFLYRSSTHIVSVTQAFRENLAERGILRDKISVVMNGVNLSRFKPQTRDAPLVRKLCLEGRTVVGYVGTIGMAHGLGTVLDAAAILQNDPRSDNVTFLFLGDGAEKEALRAEAEFKSIKNVLFLDTVSREEIPRYWSLLDIAIIHLKDVPLFRTVIPSKLFECMAMGIPVLHGVRGESAELVEREGFGLLFEPENAFSLSERLFELLADAPLRARLAARAIEAVPRHNRTAPAQRMLDTLVRLHFDAKPSSAHITQSR